MRSHRTTLPYSLMDDSLERFITDLSTMCRRHPSVLREVVEGYVNNLEEDDFSRWEETMSQLWKNSESPNKKLEFSKSGIPLHMLDSIQIQELNEHELRMTTSTASVLQKRLAIKLLENSDSSMSISIGKV